MMGHMPAIPESTRDSITWRLLQHAGTHWPQLSTVQVRCRGSFAYITGVLPGGEQIPLCRLRYGGSARSFGFAIYSAARASYDDAVLATGLHAGTPQEALDTACTVHLAGLGHEPADEPPTNLRGYPLRVSLRELHHLPAETLMATSECAGHGRSGFDPPAEGEQSRSSRTSRSPGPCTASWTSATCTATGWSPSRRARS